MGVFDKNGPYLTTHLAQKPAHKNKPSNYCTILVLLQIRHRRTAVNFDLLLFHNGLKSFLKEVVLLWCTYDFQKLLLLQEKFGDYVCFLYRGAIGGKTGKTMVLPWFCKIEHGSGGAPLCYGGLSLSGRTRRASSAPGLGLGTSEQASMWLIL